MVKTPKVSLVMKVYNGEKYLRQAMDSILAQTFSDFEFLIIDDGSKDSSADIVRTYSDERIRFIQNEKNMGLCATQNRVIGEAKGEYIAVMDCDDISYPTRFEKQVKYLDQHPNVMMCGSFRDDIVDEKVSPFQQVMELEHSTLRFSLFFGNMFFTHSSIMFRTHLYNKEGLTYGAAPIAEDYGIIIEMAKRYDLAMIPERLIAYRIYNQSTSKVRLKEITEAACNLKCDYLNTLDISENSKALLKEYYRTSKAVRPLHELQVAIQEIADKTGADISVAGNAFPVASSVVQEYYIKLEQYSLMAWKELRRSPYKKIGSLKTITGWKLFVASILKYKRKSL